MKPCDCNCDGNSKEGLKAKIVSIVKWWKAKGFNKTK